MKKLPQLLVLGFLTITTSTLPAFSSLSDKVEGSAEISTQLKSYQSVTKWIINNKDNFNKLLEHSAINPNTRWNIQDKSDNMENTNNLTNTVTNPASTPIDNTPANPANASNVVQYVVQKSDTLYSIAKKYKTTVTAIKIINDLNNNDLAVGQTLTIQTSVNSTPKNLNEKGQIDPKTAPIDTSHMIPYIIQAGDTISSISRKFNMPVNTLISVNNLQNTPLYIGKSILVNTANNEPSVDNAKFNWPLVGRLLISFGTQKNGLVSNGINIMAKRGSSVKSIADGIVIYAGRQVESLGNVVLIQHEGGWISVYGYLQNINVQAGDHITQGQIIAEVGKEDNIRIPQLHFELRKNIKPENPLDYLNSYT